MAWNDAPVPTTPSYCTADQVADFRGEPAYSENETDRKRPSLKRVKAAILDMEDQIDSDTGHSWRERAVTDEEHPLDRTDLVFRAGHRWLQVQLDHRVVRSITELNVWDGSQYVDWVAEKTQGFDDDWEFEGERGVVLLRAGLVLRRENPVRVSYKYGESRVPGWVRNACIRLTAARFEEASHRRGTEEGGSFRSSPDRRTRWIEEATDAIEKHAEWVSV